MLAAGRYSLQGAPADKPEPWGQRRQIVSMFNWRVLIHPKVT